MTDAQPNGLDVTEVSCCIAGGGPAGLALGLMLARAGVKVLVLEKHTDFLRDFRGDTVQTSTLSVLEELGLLDRFLALPHEKSSALTVVTDAGETTVADFSALPGQLKYIAYVPQWELLNMLAEAAQQYPMFELRMSAEAFDVCTENDAVRGVRYRDTAGRVHEVRAPLTVAADGRHSQIRDAAGMQPAAFDAPMDVLWFRLSRVPTDPTKSHAQSIGGRLLALINRGEHWQIGWMIPKESPTDPRDNGIDGFCKELATLLPHLADRVEEIRDWDDVKVLNVRVDRLKRWYRDGFLVIGDAAHAMSPVGAVGVNLAVQDAVATANLLADGLRHGRVRTRDLARVQRRRRPAAAFLQRLQLVIQRRMLAPVLAGDTNRAPSGPAKMLQDSARMRRIMARVFTYGIRHEHVKTKQVAGTQPARQAVR